MNRFTMLLALLLCFSPITAAAQDGSADAYVEEIVAWQTGRAERLVSETGWLTVVGFFWLEPGDNPVGSGEGSLVVLPEGAADHVGTLRYTVDGDAWTVSFLPADGIEATVNEEPFAGGELIPDDPGPATRVTVGRQTFWILARNGQAAVRVRDPESQLRQEFLGIDRYEIDPGMRIVGRFEPYDAPRPMIVPNQMGHADTSVAYGEVVFSVGDQRLSLIPMMDDAEDDKLFFVFSDATTGSETYEAGRFLYLDRQEDGTVVMDFNRAYNPPCAFNPWTTCPLPPDGNRLSLPIRAGEKKYAGADAQ